MVCGGIFDLNTLTLIHSSGYCSIIGVLGKELSSQLNQNFFNLSKSIVRVVLYILSIYNIFTLDFFNFNISLILLSYNRNII